VGGARAPDRDIRGGMLGNAVVGVDAVMLTTPLIAL